MTAVVLAAIAGAGAATLEAAVAARIAVWWQPEHTWTHTLFGGFQDRGYVAAAAAPLFLPADPAIVTICATATLAAVLAVSWLTIRRLLRNLQA